MEPVYQVSHIKYLLDVLHSFLFMTLYNQLSKYILNRFSSSLLTTIIQVTIIFCLDYCTRWISFVTFLLHHHEHTYVQLSAQESKYWPDYFISHQTFFKTQILLVAYKTLHYLAPKIHDHHPPSHYDILPFLVKHSEIHLRTCPYTIPSVCNSLVMIPRRVLNTLVFIPFSWNAF